MAANPIREVIQNLPKTVLLRDGMTDAQLLTDYLVHHDDAALANAEDIALTKESLHATR
jgi:hypothetical protein